MILRKEEFLSFVKNNNKKILCFEEFKTALERLSISIKLYLLAKEKKNRIIVKFLKEVFIEQQTCC